MSKSQRILSNKLAEPVINESAGKQDLRDIEEVLDKA